MAKRVTPDEVVEMIRLYKEIGTYAAVAREVKRDAGTVARYVQMKNVPVAFKIAVENSIRTV